MNRQTASYVLFRLRRQHPATVGTTCSHCPHCKGTMRGDDLCPECVILTEAPNFKDPQAEKLLREYNRLLKEQRTLEETILELK